jgi:hypothetical protein
MDLQTGDRAAADVATLPAREPGVPGQGPDGGAPHPAGLAGWLSRHRGGLLFVAVSLVAINIARYSNAHGRGVVPQVAAIALAAGGLFALCGLGLTRLLLPAGLRRYEWLWVLPVGACAVALALTALGFAAVPFKVSLAVVIALGAAFSVFAVRRAGWPERPRPLSTVGWPVWIAVLAACIALVPLFRAGYLTVVGQGSDAHLAVGTAQFLQHNYPTSTNIAEPVDSVPLVWKSKQPIYYALGAVSSLVGRPPYQVISTVAALMLALSALGFFLFAREALGGSRAAALGAMGIVALDRMVLLTVTHPYFNQTWGFFTLPFSLLLAWWAVKHRSYGGWALLVLFLAVGAFAYPLELPIPLIALAVFAWDDRRVRRERGEPVWELRLRERLRGRKRYVIPVVAILSVPIVGVLEKAISGSLVVFDPGRSLAAWGGDLRKYYPEYQFLALAKGTLWPLVLIGLGVAAWWALRAVERPLALGLLAVFVVAAVGALEFRARAHGYYFHFKILAFVAPILIACAVVGVMRLRGWGAVLLALYVSTAQLGAAYLMSNTFDETPKPLVALRGWSKALPRDASIRLDMKPGAQLWAQYMVYEHPTCSEHPLVRTQYPRVPLARRATYVLTQFRHGVPAGRPIPAAYRPRDAVGGALFHDVTYGLWKLRPGLPDVPHAEGCSRRMVQDVKSVPLGLR